MIIYLTIIITSLCVNIVLHDNPLFIRTFITQTINAFNFSEAFQTDHNCQFNFVHMQTLVTVWLSD